MILAIYMENSSDLVAMNRLGFNHNAPLPNVGCIGTSSPVPMAPKIDGHLTEKVI